ncbi:MAG: DcaP family trimeric outer membrane transporter [Burkholderiaceae bacterium]
MMLNKTVIGAAIAAAFMSAVPAHAQSAKDFEEMRAEIKRLRAEVDALKKTAPAAAAPAAASTGWGDRIEALEVKSGDAVVKGDIGGSFRLPGSETSLRFYGFAEGHAIHDLKQAGPSDTFTDLMFQPLDGSGGQKGKTKFTAQTSRFGFESSTPTELGAFNTKVEMDFYSYGSGNRNRLRLRHAYGEYAGFLVGQTWSTFMDLDDLPETVDFNGPIGAPFSRRTMVRYTYADAKAGYKLTAALEDPEDQFGGGSANERMPQIVLRADKSFDWGAVNARVLAHEKRSFAETKRGFGFGVGGSYKITDKDLLMGQYTRVDGDIDQLYGSNGYAIDATTGAITFDKNQGLVVAYAKTFSDQLRGTLSYGMNRGKTAQAVDNRTLQQVFINVVYSPIKNVELGAEYIWGKRKTFTPETGTMSRFDLMGRYSF